MLGSLVHHAYVLSGGADAVSALLSELSRLGYETAGNPDIRVEYYDTLGIDETRALKEAAGRTSVTGGKKIFVTAARSMTREAQNALLKLFEEPPKETHFFLFLSTLATLLPTLRSRLEVLSQESFAVRTEGVHAAREFLQDTRPVRLKSIQALLGKVEKGERGKESLSDFLNALERAAAKGEVNSPQALGEILEAQKYSRDRAASWKLILEHLALVLPQMK
jgi:hypothetical protein